MSIYLYASETLLLKTSWYVFKCQGSFFHLQTFAPIQVTKDASCFFQDKYYKVTIATKKNDNIENVSEFQTFSKTEERVFIF